MADKVELTQKELDDKIAEAVTTAVEKLNTKNSDLVGELKKARKRTAAFEGFDADEVKLALEMAKKGEQTALEKKGDYEKAMKLATENHATEIKKLTDQLDVSTKSEKKLRVETAMVKAMDEIKVPPQYRAAVLAMKAGDISIIDKDGKPTEMMGDKSVTEAMKAWAETDDGKNFVGDGGGGGGGAGGGSNTDGVKNPWAKDTRNLSQQGIMERDHPAQAAQLKQAAGV